MRVCVIGGGVGGLTAARALVAAGLDARVREAGSRVGGVIASTRSDDGYVREHAASSFLGDAPRGARALCEELGVPMDTASPRAKRRWIYLDGKLRALPRGPLEFVRSDLLTWRGKLDLLREPTRPPRAGDESVHAFASRRFGAEAARAIVAPFVTGIYAADAHDISLEAGFPRLAELDTAGGLVRGLAARAARNAFRRLAGAPARRPVRGLFAPHGGLERLVDALATTLGDRIQTDAPVRSIVPSGRTVLVDGEPWDAVVLAVPAQDARALVEAVPALGDRLDGFHRAPAAIVYLGYAEAAVPRAVDGFGFLSALGEELRVLGVVFESVVWPERAPDGHVLLRCIFGGGRDPAAAALGDAELIAHARHDLGVVLGATGSPVHASVVRHRLGVAQYPLGHRERVRAAVAVARTHRIALAGADYRGSGLNDLCADADVIVEEVRSWV